MTDKHESDRDKPKSSDPKKPWGDHSILPESKPKPRDDPFGRKKQRKRVKPQFEAGETIADPCSSCEGEGRSLRRRKLEVSIPAGVDEGTRIRVAGEGEAGLCSAAHGDLYLFVHLKRPLLLL